MVKFDTNRWCAAIVFIVAFIVYAMSMAPSESFWDCGEFAACSYTLAVPHPPGTPIFLLLGRIFSILPISPDVAVRVTYMSVLAGALAVMLAYLIIVRVIRLMRGPEISVLDKIIAYGGGVVGSLSLAWSYSMWFNTVESEVYASSQFFTHIVVWLIFVWHEKADEANSGRWLLLIAYMIGIAIGVHLLNVLTIPALALVVYYRRRPLEFLPLFLGSLIAGVFLLITYWLGSSINLQSPLWLANAVVLAGLWAAYGCIAYFGRGVKVVQISGMLVSTAVIFWAIYPGIVKNLPLTASVIGNIAPLLITLAIVGVFIWAWVQKHGVIGTIAAGALLIIISYSAMMEIYIRSGMNPGIDENDPDSPARFFSYLNREQYGDRAVFPRYWNNDPEYKNANDYFWRYQVNKMFNRYLFWQFIGREGAPHNEYQDAGVSPKYSLVSFIKNEPTGGLRWLGIITCVPFLLGLGGFAYQFSKDKKGWLVVAALFFMTGYAIILYLNQDDPQPRERDYSYVGAFFAFAIWIGIGASAVIEWVAEQVKNLPSSNMFAAATAGLLVVLSPVIMLAKNYEMDKRTGNHVAEDYSYNMLNSCDQNGIIFTNGDNDTFPVWYLQEAKHVRRDVRIANLSLLNTGWYIKQLKNRDPKVPISFSDNYIDRYLDGHDSEALLKRYWPADKQKVELNTPDGKMVWTMPAAMYVKISEDEKDRQNNFLRVQDIMILDILRTNYDASRTPVPRPVYFAVTCANSNMIGLRDYLTFEGLVFRISPRKNAPMDAAAVRRNFFTTFNGHFRGINDSHVHFDDNVEKLLQNYRSGFLQLAYYYSTLPDSTPQAELPSKSADELIRNFDKLSNRQKALAVMMKMDAVIPESIRPISNPELSVQIGRMYSDLGRPDEFRRRLEAATTRTDIRQEQRLRLAAYWFSYFNDSTHANKLIADALGPNPSADQYYSAGREMFSAGAYPAAAEYFNKCLTMNQDDGQAIGGLLQCYQNMGDLISAQTLLESWLARHPGDKGAKQRLDQLHGHAVADTNTPRSVN